MIVFLSIFFLLILLNILLLVFSVNPLVRKRSVREPRMTETVRTQDHVPAKVFELGYKEAI